VRTLQAGPTVRQTPSVLALNYVLAVIRKFSAAYSEYAWHYTGMLCEQHEASAHNGVTKQQPLQKRKDDEPWPRTPLDRTGCTSKPGTV
jgi:hypothetical protein